GTRVPTTLKRGAFRTVGQRHKDQLNLLMAQLNSTQPHFVRCILPNSEKRAGKIDTPLVLDQLRCNGVLEGIRITRQGFPNRIPFLEFRQRYEILAPNTIPRQVFVDSKQAASKLLEAFKMDKAKYRLGHTKVFFRAGVLGELEEIRDVELSKIIVQFQAMARGALSRSRFRRRIEQAKAIRVIQRNARVYNQLCEWPWWKLYRTVKPLLHVTRVDEEMRKKESRIGELEQLARTEADERKRLESEHHELNREKDNIASLLDAERRAALDQEEILKRTQEREEALEDSLRKHAQRLEELEEQCAELAHDKAGAEHELAKLSQQMESEAVSMRDLASQHHERDQALADAEIKTAEYCRALEDLEQDYAKTVERIGSTEAALAASRESEARLDAELAHMREALEQRDAELDSRAQAEVELETLSNQTASELAQMQARADEAIRARDAAVIEGDKSRAQLAEARSMCQALERDTSETAIKLATVEQTLGNTQQEKLRLIDANSRMMQDIDELRQLIDEKADQGTRESELRRMRESELTKLRDELGDVAGELEEFRTAHIESEQMMRSEIDQLRRERDTALQEREALETGHREIEAQLHEHVTQMEEMEAANMQLESQLTDAATRSREIETEFSSTREIHDAASKERDTLRERLDATVAERDEVAAQLAKAKAAAEQSQSDFGGASKELADAQKTIGELHARLEENDNLRDTIQQRITLQAQEFEELKEKYNQDA
ncbi:class II myosin, partial [Coemansia sp. RSA 1824]